MKKSLSLLLAIALIFTMFAPAALADNHDELTVQAKYQALLDAGIFEGHADGTAGLDEDMNRAQAAVIIAKLFDLDVSNAPSTATFPDVPVTHWGHPYVEAAVAEGIINGHANGTFGPSENVQSQQLAVMLSLGYADQFGLEVDMGNTADAGESAAYAKAFINAAVDWDLMAAQADYTNDAKRAELVVATYSTQVAVVKAEAIANLSVEEVQVIDGSNIIVTFSNNDVIAYELDPALEANVATEVTITHEATGKEILHEVTYVVDQLAVDSVTANSLKEVVVNFNSEAGSDAGKAANYAITGNTVAAVSLADDKKSATLTLGTAITQQGSIEVTVKKAAGLEANSKTKITGVIDSTIPVAQSVELIAPNKFTVTFSEPVSGGSVEINSGVYGVTNYSYSDNGRVVTVTTSAATLTEGTYDVKVKDFVDYAGFKAVATNFDLEYVKDTTAPTVSLKSASQTEVVVEFDKAVTQKGGAALDETFFYHTYTAWQPVEVTTTDNKVFTLSFKDNDPNTTDYYLPEGNVTVTVLKKAGAEVVDEWGNEMATDATLNATISVDKDVPTITKVEATAENKIVVTFSESVLQADAETNGSYTIKDSDDKAVGTIDKVVYDSGKKTATITLTSKLSGGTYTIETKDIKDTSLAGNKLATVTNSFVVTDKTAPALVAQANNPAVLVGATGDQLLYVTFNEKVAVEGSNSALDKSNYVIAGVTLGSDDKVELFGTTGTKVKITIADRGTGNEVVANNDLTIGRIADLAGNIPSALTQTRDITDPVALTASNAKVIDTKTVTFEVNGILTTVVADGFTAKKTVTGDVYGLASVSYEVKGSKTIVTGTLKSEVQLTSGDGTDYTDLKLNVVSGKIKSDIGQEMGTQTDIAVADGFAPSYKSIAKGGTGDGKFTLTFTESIAANALLSTDLVIVDADGKTLVAGNDFDAVANGTADVVVTLTGGYAGHTGKLTVSTKESVTYIKDGASIKANAFSGKTVTLD